MNPFLNLATSRSKLSTATSAVNISCLRARGTWTVIRRSVAFMLMTCASWSSIVALMLRLGSKFVALGSCISIKVPSCPLFRPGSEIARLMKLNDSPSTIDPSSAVTTIPALFGFEAGAGPTITEISESAAVTIRDTGFPPMVTLTTCDVDGVRAVPRMSNPVPSAPILGTTSEMTPDDSYVKLVVEEIIAPVLIISRIGPTVPAAELPALITADVLSKTSRVPGIPATSTLSTLLPNPRRFIPLRTIRVPLLPLCGEKVVI